MLFLTGKPGFSRKYTQHQKDEFFVVLDRLGTVTAAAAELSLNRNTCMQWASKAGVRGRLAGRLIRVVRSSSGCARPDPPVVKLPRVWA
ncbi:hypothetical protein [Pseudarthrobacter sp. H2]|uniref:hypothetical protein n=1 Tax=Pseudarthrobacter sp. H2 TaxID=3418415 RepID=UPI003CF7CB6E